MHSTLLASGNYIVRSNKAFFLRELLKIELEASAKSLPEMGFFFLFQEILLAVTTTFKTR